MKAFRPRAITLLPLFLASSALGEALPHLFESDGPGPPNKLYWQTEPGIRYDLWESPSLDGWSRVTGFPKVAEGLAMEHAFTPSPTGKGGSIQPDLSSGGNRFGRYRSPAIARLAQIRGFIA